MTNLELHRFARDYANEVYNGDTDFMDEAENVISWLTKTHYIVSKEKVKELCRLIIENSCIVDYGLIVS